MNIFYKYLNFYCKKKKVLKFFSHFSFLIPSYLLYQIFKNLIIFGEYKLCKKIYLTLSRRNLRKDLAEKIFISKVVLIEIQKNLGLDLIDIKKEKKYLSIKKFIDNPNKNLNNYLKKDYDPTIISKIITEFIYCDYLIPITSSYFKAEMVLNMHGYKKKSKIVVLDNWWFQALGHIIYLDTFIKGVLLKIIDVQRISFDGVDKICNYYLFNKYKKILKEKKLYQDKFYHNKVQKVNNHKLNIRMWSLSKPKKILESENIQEYIQTQWRKKNVNFFNEHDDLNAYKKLKKKIKSKSKIILIHVRQNDFHPITNNANSRNSDLRTTLNILNKIKGNHLFVIIGAPGNKRIKEKFKNLFDYSNSKLKSEKNDILLLNFCDAFIGNTSGPAHYMLTRNKPCLYVNWFPFEMALKNSKTIIMPKLIKKNNKILPFGKFYKLGLRFIYEGIVRMDMLGYKLVDNNEEDLFDAINNFVISLNRRSWKNYGKKCSIKKKNFSFLGIKKNLKSDLITYRRELFFEPTFIKRYKDFIR
mgnify:CR=1 FL=1|tara:strand:- start:123 stop:1706 length:1584 start_codon:yes stop_codon:yes gene_type:complete